MPTPIDPGTRIGHVHLKVADLERALGFWRDLLGFELTQRYGAQAAFLSAGGYHHHVALNTWESRGATPPPPGSAALRHATIVLPTVEERDRVLGRVVESGQETRTHPDGPLVRDPSGNPLVLSV